MIVDKMLTNKVTTTTLLTDLPVLILKLNTYNFDVLFHSYLKRRLFPFLNIMHAWVMKLAKFNFI